MSKQQFKAIFLLSLLALNSECARVSIKNVLEAELSRTTTTCEVLQGRLDRLCDYTPSKVNKVETKGVAGFKGTARIVKLSRQINALAAAIKAYQEEGCEGDLTPAKENLALVIAKVKEIASSGGETTARLSRAISQAEAEMAKPNHDLAAIQALFVKTLLGGDGAVTEAEKNSITETDVADDVVVGALEETDESLLVEEDSDTPTALLEQAARRFALAGASNSTALIESGNVFLSTIKGLSQFTAIIVMSVLGFAWFLASVIGYFVSGMILAPLGAFLATIICAVWWVAGQLAEFLTWGGVKFGRNHGKCVNTIFVKPFFKPVKKGLEVFTENNPWEYIDSTVTAIGEVGIKD